MCRLQALLFMIKYKLLINVYLTLNQKNHSEDARFSNDYLG